MNTIKKRFDQQAWTFAAVGLVLFLLMIQVFFVLNQPWVADYWEHLAVVQELYRNPLNPTHPIVSADRPHAFFSPYSVGLALIGRLLAISPEMIVNAAGISNLLFVVYSIWLLSKLLIRNENQTRSFVLLLLMILFFWGILPPYYSAFYHFISLPFVSSYPATFAFSMSVVSAYLFKQAFNENRKSMNGVLIVLLCMLLNYIVLITHPLTIFFCLTLYIFLFFQHRMQLSEKRVTVKSDRLFFAAVAVAFAFPICFLPFWPYYPFFDLFTSVSPSSRFHLDSEVLYKGIAGGYFPFILPIGILIYEMAKKHGYALLIGGIICFLLLIYVGGFLRESYGYGRVISFMAIWLQVWLTNRILNIEPTRIKRIVAAAVLILAFPFFVFSLKVTVYSALTNHAEYLKGEKGKESARIRSPAVISHRLFFIKKYVKEGELVMCNPVFSRYVPGLGGKAVFNPYADYWISDNDVRSREVQLFFGTGDSLLRRKIIMRYKPSFLLFSSAEKQVADDCRGYFVSDSIFTENQIVLVKLKYD